MHNRRQREQPKKHTLTPLIALLFAGMAFGEPAAVGPKQTAVIVNQAADAIANY